MVVEILLGILQNPQKIATDSPTRAAGTFWRGSRPNINDK